MTDRDFSPMPAALEQRAFDRAEFDLRAATWPFLGRALADIRDKVNWARVRAPRIGASDAAKFAKLESAPLYLKAKLYAPFRGNDYTVHGNAREPIMLGVLGHEQNFTLYGSAGNPRHCATPDGLILGEDGTVELVQCKTILQKVDAAGNPKPAFTSAKGSLLIPPEYKRQMWWEQYVCGAERTKFVWEEHVGGQPTGMEPEWVWFDRDDAEIETLITIADLVLAGMDEAARFEREMQDA